ncbi:P-loop containing nucleoside triphosphate hydrolase protein [Polyplosphaeria fusca]|uniref:P-loop containing nucleoside triphosphate hydrolase protein n=1 Tax=Polyplosphaeria fusca TaxID=682080 RepID=A0A9P4UW43_9PLEO|nr:P-loop containing nucleoside triphosphate hydrolase protein [Polyplosphaeria fusca]
MATDLDLNVRRVMDLLAPKIGLQMSQSERPVILGITGLQGSGKSTWASKVVDYLTFNDNHAFTVSLDDFYKTHDDLIAQRDRNPENRLYRTRGQPGTHDEQLAKDFFARLTSWEDDSELQIPSFDKSRFNGEGDRAPVSSWAIVRQKPHIVVFEGWCLGFRPLEQTKVESKYQFAQEPNMPNGTASTNETSSTNTLSDHKLAHLHELNQSLSRYNDTFMGPQHIDFLIHIDTNDLKNVYRWRLQQEHAMIEEKGTGMTDDQVVSFIRGYMPSYELYLDGLRDGFYPSNDQRQARVVLGGERQVEDIKLL